MNEVSPADLSISVVVYHPDIPALTTTLKSLRSAIDCARIEGELGKVVVTVIDNGTRDVAGLHRTLAGGFPPSADVDLATVGGQGNVGYGRGHNLAITASRTEYHLVLNPDVELDRGALCEALRFLRLNPEIGMVTPEVRGSDGEIQYLCRRYPSLLVLLLRGFAPPLIKRRFAGRLDRYELRDRLTEPVVRGIPLVSGCFILARREVLQAVNGFSADYFLYFEDYDLSLRVRRISDIAYVQGVRITHYGGDAAKKGPEHIRMFLGSAYRFFRTHGWKLI